MHDAPSFFKGNLLKVVLRNMLAQLLITHGLGGYRENVLLESPATAASSDLYIARYIIVNIVNFGK